MSKEKQFDLAYQNKVQDEITALPSLAFSKPLEYPISCALLLHQVFVQMPVDPCMPVIQEQGPAPKRKRPEMIIIYMSVKSAFLKQSRELIKESN